MRESVREICTCSRCTIVLSMTTTHILLCLLATAALVTDAIKPPPDDDWDTITPFTFPPGFTLPTLTLPTRPTVPTLTLPTQQTFPSFTFPTKPRPTSPTATLPTNPRKRCKDIQNRRDCIANRPCPEGPDKSFCHWIPIYSKLPLDQPIGADEYETQSGHHNKNNLEKWQISNSDDILHLLQSLPYPKVVFNHGYCICCRVTSCESPQEFNSVFCRCECPKGTRENAEGECIGDCSSNKDLDLCPKIYCADNPHFSCKRDGNQCKCPSCDTATDRTLCVHTQCLEQPQKVTCVFDSETRTCHCPACEDQNGDRLGCLMTHCGLNNSLQCKWKATKCFCPTH